MGLRDIFEAVEDPVAVLLGLFLMNQVAALIFPLAASKQLRRALTIRYRDSSVDSNILGTSLDQGVSSHFNPFSRDRDRANVASIIIRFYIDAGKPSKGPSRRALKIRGPRRGASPSPGWGVAGSVIRIEA